MRELAYKIKKLAKSRSVDCHRRMLGIKNDTVLVIVNIGRILKKPIAIINPQGNDSVILPRGGSERSRISLIFAAESTFRISALLHKLRRRNRFRVFFGLG